MEEKEKIPFRKQLLTVPNLLGYFRILLIPAFVLLYVKEHNYIASAALIALSGITDMLDGYIARRFHMVTQLGKALDPVADKLTQAAMAICLATQFSLMLPLLILFLLKEGYMAVMGILMLGKGRMLDGAMWFGKICTAFLYAVMFLLFLFPAMPGLWANILIGSCIGFLLFSFIMYIPVYSRMRRQEKDR